MVGRRSGVRLRTAIAAAVGAAVLASVALVAGVTGPAAAAPAPAGIPVIVDTDMGPDDVVALLYLVRRPEVDLVGVVVNGTGLVRCPVGARNALAVLAVVGRTDVPVACGPDDPVDGFNAFPLGWRDAADALFGLRLAASPRAPEPDGGVALLRSLVDEQRSPAATVMLLGPATDLAVALRADGSLAGRIGRVVSMAGAFGVPGNIGPGHERAEYNAWVDPVAMQEVLRSGVPVTFVPLDATNRVPATVFVSRALRPLRHATPAGMLAYETMTWGGLVAGGQYFWDPLAAVAVAQPSLVRTAGRQVRVVVASGSDQGRLLGGAGGVPARVVTSVDTARFEAALLTTLTGRPVAAPARRATVTVSTDGSGCAIAGRRTIFLPSGPGQDGATLETVNRSSRTMTHAIGLLRDGKTLADLRAAARDATDSGEPPPWFEVFHSGQTPPHSTMTWELGLPPDRFAVACVLTPRARAWVAGEISVSVAR